MIIQKNLNVVYITTEDLHYGCDKLTIGRITWNDIQHPNLVEKADVVILTHDDQQKLLKSRY